MSSAVVVDRIGDDLVAEQAALDAVVTGLSGDQWALPTPSPRWSVADQIAHLTYFDRQAAVAITAPDTFVEHRNELVARFADPIAVDDVTLGPFRQLAPAELLDAWRTARSGLGAAAQALGDDDRVEWYGPSMSSKSFLTARLMEVWAHGQDVVDTIGGVRPDTDRLIHVAQLGVLTRGWSYVVRGEMPPDSPVRVELAAPSGATWEWGPAGAASSITGPAGDFCRVVTQRRHVDDTALMVTGDAGREWMHKAQAFAGMPSDGPAARTTA